MMIGSRQVQIFLWSKIRGRLAGHGVSRPEQSAKSKIQVDGKTSHVRHILDSLRPRVHFTNSVSRETHPEMDVVNIVLGQHLTSNPIETAHTKGQYEQGLIMRQ